MRWGQEEKNKTNYEVQPGEGQTDQNSSLSSTEHANSGPSTSRLHVPSAVSSHHVSRNSSGRSALSFDSHGAVDINSNIVRIVVNRSTTPDTNENEIKQEDIPSLQQSLANEILTNDSYNSRRRCSLSHSVPPPNQSTPFSPSDDLVPLRNSLSAEFSNSWSNDLNSARSSVHDTISWHSHQNIRPNLEHDSTVDVAETSQNSEGSYSSTWNRHTQTSSPQYHFEIQSRLDSSYSNAVLKRLRSQQSSGLSSAHTYRSIRSQDSESSSAFENDSLISTPSHPQSPSEFHGSQETFNFPVSLENRNENSFEDPEGSTAPQSDPNFLHTVTTLSSADKSKRTPESSYNMGFRTATKVFRSAYRFKRRLSEPNRVSTSPIDNTALWIDPSRVAFPFSKRSSVVSPTSISMSQLQDLPRLHSSSSGSTLPSHPEESDQENSMESQNAPIR